MTATQMSSDLARVESRLLEDKVAIVTGASRGIGAAAARAFAAAGATVVLTARSTRHLQDVAMGITAGGGDALAVPTDVGDGAAAQRLVQRALDTFGRLDAAFNNAGQSHMPTPAPATPPRRSAGRELSLFL